MNSYPDSATRHYDWAALDNGDFVLLSAPNGQRIAGTVEDRTEDSTIIWVRNLHNERKLFHIDDGYKVVPTRLEHHLPQDAAR
ncbi:hypothetical protein [Pseudarthrobacter sp. NKDBFgelt]|uniref:hypothetical protein n=1 Tax=Pseudarthrobacter sp. NKDBFgelt TaxID=3384443 RepID=UPI0038D3FF0F